jgi:formate-dependent nitrite reductase membrane component NrfD
VLPGYPAPSGFLGGALRALVQPLGAEPPGPGTQDALVRADQVFLVIELFLIGLFFVGLLSGSASQIASVDVLMGGGYAVVFWGGVIAIGIVTPLVLQALQLTHRIPHTVIPAILVLAGGLALRWVMVGAGQASRMVAAGGM